MSLSRKHLFYFVANAGLAGVSVYSLATAQHSHRYQRRLREGVELCRANGRDPQQWLLGVIADIQSMQRSPVRGPLHRVEVECVRRELARVAERPSAEI